MPVSAIQITWGASTFKKSATKASARRATDRILKRLLKEKFKQQCGTVFFDDFFDFIAENYGESQEGAEEFLNERMKSHANYRYWKQEKKRGNENL